MAIFDLTHARHDPAHCLAKGLFRSLRKGERKKLKLNVTYDHGAQQIRFVGFEPLGADDLRYLQGLVALGGPGGVILEPEPESEESPKAHLRLFLEPKLEATGMDALAVRSTISHLLHEVGLSRSGQNIEAMRESLCRMANVTVIVRKGAREASFKLLSYGFDEDTGELLVALNPRLCGAILGTSKKYVHIELAEVRRLASDPARLIHQRLCAWVDVGKTGDVKMETLIEYVWPDAATNPNTMKSRKSVVRRALAELRALAWSVDEYASGKFTIQRAALQIEGAM